MIERIGIDLHGVIDNDVEWFKEILETIHLRTFITVHIISGPPTEEIKAELDKFSFEHGLHYEGISSVVDYLKGMEVKMWKDYKDTWWADDSEWWRAKAAICEKLDIDIMIDDKEEYKNSFEKIKTKFMLYTG